MSLLTNQTSINPNSFFFSTQGGGGGGAVNQVTGGTGISVSPRVGNVVVTNTGVVTVTAGQGISVTTTDTDVTVTNSGVISAVPGNNITLNFEDGVLVIGTTDEINIASPFSATNETGIEIFSVFPVGKIVKNKFYFKDYEFYTCGMSFTISNISCINPYTGTLMIALEYGGFKSYSSIVVSDSFSQSYAVNLVLGFQSNDSDTLVVTITNQLTEKINSFDYGVSNFYCVIQGLGGATGMTLFD